jgi:hypothetical protein
MVMTNLKLSFGEFEERKKFETTINEQPIITTINAKTD